MLRRQMRRVGNERACLGYHFRAHELDSFHAMYVTI